MSDLQIIAIGAVAVAVIGSIFTGIVSVVVALRTSKKADEIHTLVNGQSTALLREITELKERVATLTGRSADAVAAVSAKANLDDKIHATALTK